MLLLRQIAEGQGNRDVLEILTEKLVELGRQIFAIRAGFFRPLKMISNKFISRNSPGPGIITASIISPACSPR